MANQSSTPLSLKHLWGLQEYKVDRRVNMRNQNHLYCYGPEVDFRYDASNYAYLKYT